MPNSRIAGLLDVEQSSEGHEIGDRSFDFQQRMEGRLSLFAETIPSHRKRRTISLLGFDELGAHLQPLVCACAFPRRSDA